MKLQYLSEYGLNASAVGLEYSLEVLERILALSLAHNSQLQPALEVTRTKYIEIRKFHIKTLTLRISPSLD